MKIIVCGLSAAQNEISRHRAKSVISVLGPETPHRDFVGVGPENHLKLTFNDINQATQGLKAPEASDIEKLVGFVKRWDQQAPMLIHCWAGISRSTASALTALCILKPSESEFALAQKLRMVSPSATPNKLIAMQADNLLQRQGRLFEAAESIGRGANAFEGVAFVLEI